MTDLTVALTTTITLNGNQRNTVNQVTLNNINFYDSRVMPIPSNVEVTVVSFNPTQVASGTFVTGSMEYFQVQNLDAVNYARLRVNVVNSYSFDVRLDPGKFFIMGNTKEYATNVGTPFTSFVDCYSINMQAIGSQPIDIEYVLATS